MRACMFVATGIALWVVPCAARADFVPGNIYTTKSNVECGSGGVFGRIYEFNPTTLEWKLFADLPGFCLLSGMTFTPDGKHLRVAAHGTNSILEFDGSGNWKVVLNQSNGIHNPDGTNNICYDPSGNFFVLNSGALPNHNILKFPGGSPPGSVFATTATGLAGKGPLISGPDGSIYYNPEIYGPNQVGAAILRYAPDGTMSFFDIVAPNTSVGAFAFDSVGNLYVSSGSGLYRYENADPAKKEMVSGQFFDPSTGIALSADERTLYTTLGGMLAVDLTSGATSLLAPLPPEPLIVGWSKGMAMYVPEPAASYCFLLGLLSVLLHTRARR